MDDALETLVAALAAGLRACGVSCEVRRTHISILLLAGDRAYKFKRSLILPFLDFSTLELRRHFCERELALNRRFGDDLYIEVVPITGTPDDPVLRGEGEPIEYAVVMRRFDEDRLMSRALARGEVSADDITAFARTLAGLHGAAAVSATGSALGGPEVAGAQIRATLDHHEDVRAISDLRERVESSLLVHRDDLRARKIGGFVRECHGDLHLGNVLLCNGRVRLFDCIEFNDELRVIDTASDLAFVVMDLDTHGSSELANQFLNAYLDASGDHGAVSVLTLYCAYRALVRAAVAEIERRGHAGDDDTVIRRRDRYLSLARAYLHGDDTRAGLVITHGVSGSGKSTVSRALARRCGFVHLRSDRERLRLAGRDDGEVRPVAVGEGLYTAERTAATYERLLQLATEILGAGLSVVVDATFLDASWRRRFAALAARLDTPFHILHCEAPEAELRRRIEVRRHDGGDPSEATVAVLRAQLAAEHCLEPSERAACTDAADLDVEHATADRLAVLGRARLQWSPPD
jgi:aminoglycoside phosphotransferase family enzyme/predicted kinase